jgi:hypothetical protein
MPGHPDQFDVAFAHGSPVGLFGIGLGLGNVRLFGHVYFAQVALAYGDVMLRRLFAGSGFQEQRPFGLGEEVRHDTAAAQGFVQGLGNPLLHQCVLVFRGAQLGDPRFSPNCRPL